MPIVTIEQAQAQLPQLIEQLTAGEPVIIITQGEKPVARLTGLAPEQPRSIPGRCKGMLTIISDDDEHLKDWAEYM